MNNLVLHAVHGIVRSRMQLHHKLLDTRKTASATRLKSYTKGRKYTEKDKIDQYNEEYEKAKAVLNKCFGANKNFYWDVSSENPYFLKCYQPKKLIGQSQEECKVIIRQLFPEDTDAMRATNNALTDVEIANEVAMIQELTMSPTGLNISSYVDWNNEKLDINKATLNKEVDQASVQSNNKCDTTYQELLEKQNFNAEKACAEMKKQFKLLDQLLVKEQQELSHDAFHLTVSNQPGTKEESKGQHMKSSEEWKESTINVEEEINKLLNPDMYVTNLKDDSKYPKTKAARFEKFDAKESVFNVEYEIQRQLNMLAHNCYPDQCLTFPDEDKLAEDEDSFNSKVSSNKTFNKKHKLETLFKSNHKERPISSSENMPVIEDPMIVGEYIRLPSKETDMLKDKSPSFSKQNARLRAEAQNYAFDPAYLSVTYKFCPTAYRSSGTGAHPSKYTQKRLISDKKDSSGEYNKEYEKAKAILDKCFSPNNHLHTENEKPYFLKCYQPKKPTSQSQEECEVIIKQLFPEDSDAAKETTTTTSEEIAAEASKIEELTMSPGGLNIPSYSDKDINKKTPDAITGASNSMFDTTFHQSSSIEKTDTDTEDAETSVAETADAEKSGAEVDMQFKLLDQQLMAEQQNLMHEAFYLSTSNEEEQKDKTEAQPVSDSAKLEKAPEELKETDPVINVEEEIEKQLNPDKCVFSKEETLINKLGHIAEPYNLNALTNMASNITDKFPDSTTILSKKDDKDRPISTGENMPVTEVPTIVGEYARLPRQPIIQQDEEKPKEKFKCSPSKIEDVLLEAEVKNYSFDPAFLNVTYKFCPIPTKKVLRHIQKAPPNYEYITNRYDAAEMAKREEILKKYEEGFDEDLAEKQTDKEVTISQTHNPTIIMEDLPEKTAQIKSIETEEPESGGTQIKSPQCSEIVEKASALSSHHFLDKSVSSDNPSEGEVSLTKMLETLRQRAKEEMNNTHIVESSVCDKQPTLPCPPPCQDQKPCHPEPRICPDAPPRTCARACPLPSTPCPPLSPKPKCIKPVCRQPPPPPALPPCPCPPACPTCPTVPICKFEDMSDDTSISYPQNTCVANLTANIATENEEHGIQPLTTPYEAVINHISIAKPKPGRSGLSYPCLPFFPPCHGFCAMENSPANFHIHKPKRAFKPANITPTDVLALTLASTEPPVMKSSFLPLELLVVVKDVFVSCLTKLGFVNGALVGGVVKKDNPSGVVRLRAKSFDPWVPIPSLPHPAPPKRSAKKPSSSRSCEYCDPPPVLSTCKENPCKLLPKWNGTNRI